MNTEAAADKGSNLKQFSEQELNKLQENAGLKKPEEILQSLKKIKILKFSDDVTAESYNIYDDNGEYYITLWLSNDYSVTANAKTGELISVYGGLYIMEASAGANTVLEDEETADARIAEFLKSYSPKSGEYRETERNTSDNVLTIIYTRYVNDIVCPNDSIYISYNLASEQLERYNISYSEKAVFPKPDGIISADDAFDIMFEKNGLQKEYVCVNDKNEYKLCVLFELSYDIDAFTGKSAYDDDSSWPYEHNSYTDIIGHWCETAAKTLEDSGIAFNGSLLKPDEAITQEDLLRLVRVKADSYSMTCTPEVLYTILEDIEPLEEDSAASGVTRETACMYFARALNIYKYTADGNMFNLPFSDADKISKNKAGSVALLASAGVIGNSGSFRPKDYITYAEAVTILYNILKAGL